MFAILGLLFSKEAIFRQLKDLRVEFLSLETDFIDRVTIVNFVQELCSLQVYEGKFAN